MGQPRKVNYQFFKRLDANNNVEPTYAELERLIANHHPMLANTKFALAWQFSWKPDADGKQMISQTRKVSDLNRQLHGHDFEILINHTWWNATTTTPAWHTIALDHALCHARPNLDENEDEKVDETGKTDYHCRKHDIEEFSEIFVRYGQQAVLDFHANPEIRGEDEEVENPGGTDEAETPETPETPPQAQAS